MIRLELCKVDTEGDSAILRLSFLPPAGFIPAYERSDDIFNKNCIVMMMETVPSATGICLRQMAFFVRSLMGQNLIRLLYSMQK
jgi:hypothetical protein